jgi:ABC-2 type transport system ATP-binding protein
MEEASQMCDRIAIINHRKITAMATPARLKRTTEGLQSVEIAFDTVSRSASEDLEALSSVTEVRKQGDKFKLYTDSPPSVLTAVWNYAQTKGLKLITVNTVGPSLEDVFVKLTGIKEPPRDGRPKGLRGQGRRTGRMRS